MERHWKAIVGIISAWNVLLAWFGYVQTRETQRMLCHHSWPRKSVVDCRWYFTGSSGVYMIVLGVGTLLAVVLVAVLLARARPGGSSKPDALRAESTDR